MIHKFLKQELDRFKDLIAMKAKMDYSPSYGDVIKFLIHFYKENPQSTKMPAIVVPRSGATISRGNVILQRKGVIGTW